MAERILDILEEKQNRDASGHGVSNILYVHLIYGTICRRICGTRYSEM